MFVRRAGIHVSDPILAPAPTGFGQPGRLDCATLDMVFIHETHPGSCGQTKTAGQLVMRLPTNRSSASIGILRPSEKRLHASFASLKVNSVFGQ